MKAEEQKIERLTIKLVMLDWLLNGTCSDLRSYETKKYYEKEFKFVEQQLKELEDEKIY